MSQELINRMVWTFILIYYKSADVEGIRFNG